MAERIPQSKMTELIEQHSALLYRYAYRLTGSSHEAEDLTQQTFLLVQQRAHQLRDEQAVRSWLLTILRNVFLKSQRHRGRIRSLDKIEEPTLVEVMWDSPIDREQLQAALLELSEEYRSPIVLFYFEEFSYQQIADHMGIPIGTVMSRLSRAKSFLKKRLQSQTDSSTITASASRSNRMTVPQVAISHG